MHPVSNRLDVLKAPAAAFGGFDNGPLYNHLADFFSQLSKLFPDSRGKRSDFRFVKSKNRIARSGSSFSSCFYSILIYSILIFSILIFSILLRYSNVTVTLCNVTCNVTAIRAFFALLYAFVLAPWSAL